MSLVASHPLKQNQEACAHQVEFEKYMKNINKISEKLHKNKGETLVETLVALIIAVLPFTFLATSIVTAARINGMIREDTSSFVTVETATALSSEGYNPGPASDFTMEFNCENDISSYVGNDSEDRRVTRYEIYKTDAEGNSKLLYYYYR